MTQDLDTFLLAPNLQFATYQHALGTQFATPLALERNRALAGRPFHATVKTRDADRLTFGRIAILSPEGYDARMSPVRHEEEVFCFNFLTEGEGFVTQDGRTSRIRAGEFAIFSNTRNLHWHFPGRFAEFVLKVPRDMLSAVCPEADLLSARCFRQLANAKFLLSLVGPLTNATLAQSSESARLSLIDAVMSLATESLREGGVAVAETPDLAKARLLIHAKDTMLRELDDCDWTAERLAERLHVSVRTLYALFEAEGTPLMTWLWDARLRKAHDLLAGSSGTAYSIADIASQCGFRNQAHFSKRFRARYGMTPREARAKGAAAEL